MSSTVFIYEVIDDSGILLKMRRYIYILLTKREGRTGRISARGLDSTDWAQRTKKTEGRYSPSTVPSKLGK